MGDASLPPLTDSWKEHFLAKAKRSKAQAQYGKGMPKEHCGICRHFMAPDACTIVAGKISAGGWCKFFTAKSDSLSRASSSDR